MGGYTLPNSDLPIMKEVRWHEFRRVGTEFRVICVLKHVSQDYDKDGTRCFTLVGTNDESCRIFNSPPTLMPELKIILRAASTRAAASIA